MITTYIGPRLYPGALTDCAATVLKTVSSAGVWMPSPAALNYDQLKALLLLRNTGYIEYASFGGYKVRGQNVVAQSPQDTPARIRAVLRAHSIEVGEIKPCRDARARGKDSYAFVLKPGQKLGAAYGEFASVYVNGNVVVVSLKG